MRPKREGSSRRPTVITQLGPNDVLIGRGSPATGNEGNIRFREVVRSLLPFYVATSRRSEKDRLARQVISIVSSRQGRFVRRVESPMEADSLNVNALDGVWIVVEAEDVIPKVKQTFRDQHSEPSEPATRLGEQERRQVGQVGLGTTFGMPTSLIVPPIPLMQFPLAQSSMPALWQGYMNLAPAAPIHLGHCPSLINSSISDQRLGVMRGHNEMIPGQESRKQSTETNKPGGCLSEGLEILAQAATHRQKETYNSGDAATTKPDSLEETS